MCGKNVINDKHMTVVWPVDDLRLSHVDRFEVTNFAGYVSCIYGGLSVHMGGVHCYLVIDLNYREQGTLKLSMLK